MSLVDILAEQIDQLELLQEVLESERLMLSQGKIDGKELEVCATNKLPIYEALDQLEQNRNQLAEQQGYGNTRYEAREYATSEGCENDWNKMHNLAQRVAQLNKLNGELIHHRLRHNQQMLNLLRESAVTLAPTYSPSGEQTSKLQRLKSKA